MIDRFKGKAGKTLLAEALRRQPLVQGNAAIANELAKATKLATFQPSDVLIQQGGADTDISFILDGRVSIAVNGNIVANRKGGQHIGEMALIDPVGRRIATVTAVDETTVARVPSTAFVTVANAYPEIWRRLAAELVERFRQRGADLREPNAEPRVFIGSSVEGLPVAKAIQAGLAHANAIVETWTQNVFTPSKGTMEALEKKAATSDFAVLIATADDAATIRGKNQAVARDNVILELGLFMGAIGRERTVFVLPRGVNMHIPTDLLGITPLTYQPPAKPADLAARLGPVCTDLETLINFHGAR